MRCPFVMLFLVWGYGSDGCGVSEWDNYPKVGYYGQPLNCWVSGIKRQELGTLSGMEGTDRRLGGQVHP